MIIVFLLLEYLAVTAIGLPIIYFTVKHELKKVMKEYGTNK